jgi:hypothetical protein
MSRSRNTANLQIKSDLKFDPESIKIIMRKPKLGDIHPLDKNEIRGILDTIPSKFIYNLKIIEFRPRKFDPGKPWGEYRPSDLKIILYSHPLILENGSEFALNMAFASIRSMSLLADHKVENGKSYSIWTKEMLKLFYLEVLCHEIGHHYYGATKFQKKRPVGKYHEVLAQNYMEKILSFIEPVAKFFNDKSERKLFSDATHNFIRKNINISNE